MSTNEVILSVLSDMAHEDPSLKTATGVAVMMALRYRSCSKLEETESFGPDAEAEAALALALLLNIFITPFTWKLAPRSKSLFIKRRNE